MKTATQASNTTEIDCTKIQGRRGLKFGTLDEAIADAERLVAGGNVRALGNHSLGELMAHLAIAIDSSIDGFAHRAPWFIRMLGPVLKPRFMARGLRPGFRLPRERDVKSFPQVTAEEGLERYRRAVARTHSEEMVGLHPVFGNLTHEEWQRFHCHHAALHLSFVVPG